MLEVFSSPETWVSLLTLTALEIVLGIDNIVFITILAGKLPKEERKKATRLGLGGALLSRLALLAAISWVTKLTTPLFSVMGYEVSGRDLVLILGGVFQIAKATFEITTKWRPRIPSSPIEKRRAPPSSPRSSDRSCFSTSSSRSTRSSPR
jgi:predicted tellurium resistance membrane protein TerC